MLVDSCDLEEKEENTKQKSSKDIGEEFISQIQPCFDEWNELHFKLIG